jgi:hypothetical protein
MLTIVNILNKKKKKKKKTDCRLHSSAREDLMLENDDSIMRNKHLKIIKNFDAKEIVPPAICVPHSIATVSH